MSLMGTLAKVAIGYAAARGVDRMSGGQGLAGLFGGAQVPSGEAQTGRAPGMGNTQDMMAAFAGKSGGDISQMLQKFASQSGFDLSALMGGATSKREGGLLSSTPGSGTGMAGLFAALGGAAAMGAKNTGSAFDTLVTKDTAPQLEESAGLLLRAMIQSAKADGRIDEAERQKITETLGEDADADDLAFLHAQLAAPVDVAALARDTPPAMAMQVYAMSLMPIRVDREGEARYLDELASALGLNQETVNTLHLQMGVKPLYG